MITRKRTSKIWLCSDEEFQKILDESKSYDAALSKFGMRDKGSNAKTLKKRIIAGGFSTTQFDQNRKRFNRRINKKVFDPTDLFTENSQYSRHCVKKYIIKLNLIRCKCQDCGVEDVWNNKKIILVLDHINGISNDNRLENLRFLCPNCNSQTETFSRRNNKYYPEKIEVEYKFPENIDNEIINKCQQCNNEFSSINTKFCSNKCAGESRKKVIRPTKEELEIMVWQKPISHIAKYFNLSDNAIRKWCKQYEINSPPRGYWTQFIRNNNCWW